MSDSGKLLPTRDEERVLREWNQTAAAYPSVSVHQLIEQQAKRSPDAIALVCGSERLTYRELDRRANRLAHHLIHCGVSRGQRVCLLHDRANDMVVAVLGILKAGAAYVPMDTAYPAARLRHIAADCEAAAVVTQAKWASNFTPGAVPVICMDSDAAALKARSDSTPERNVDPSDEVYCIYTSGSTGNPKGTVLFHRGAVNLYVWYAREFGMGAHTSFIVLSSIGHDITQKGIFGPLICGGRVVLLDSQTYDAALVLDTIEREQVTCISFVPTALYAFLDGADDRALRQLASLTHIFPGGEGLHPTRLRAWLDHPSCNVQVINTYGPTECTDLTSTHRVTPDDLKRYATGILPLGRPIANTRLYVLDPELRPVAIGEKGELCIAGDLVGGGYIHRPDLQDGKFVASPFVPGDTLYRSGDLVSYREDGVLLYHARVDHQVKVRGYRIELPEVETAIAAHHAVKQAVVTARQEAGGDTYLAAYVVLLPGESVDSAGLRDHCLGLLPDYMVPSTWTALDRFPLNEANKVDRRSLPEPTRGRPALPSAFRAPRDPLEESLAALWRDLLGFAEIGIDDRFFEAGGTSLKALQFVARAGQIVGVRIPIAQFFANPTLSTFAESIRPKHAGATPASLGESGDAAAPTVSRSHSMKRQGETDRIAIVGMAGRFAGADNLDDFWTMVERGSCGIQPLTDHDLDKAGVSAELRAQPNYVRASGWIEGADCFDAGFFGVSPREASLIDPQQRALLETAYAALEHAGCDPRRYAGKIGVYAGVARNQYFSGHLASHPQNRNNEMDLVLIGSDKDYSASRIAFKLDLRGPAVAIQSACSTSGVAMHTACLALRNGDCDAAIIGGASIPVPFKAGHLYIEGGPLSRDGRIRPFDAQASGMVLTAGAAAIVLKRLSDAQADGDTVYAIVAGTALNNDGGDKIAFTAPSVNGQTSVIKAALSAAGATPDSISYIETHGTGTPLGDPIEVAGLSQAYVGAKSISLGSVKANIGHLDAGAAAAGLIKTALALHHRKLPPMANFETPNPECGFEGSAFSISARLQDWQSESPRRAGVSAFGFGGTNFHAVLEEAPLREASPAKRSLQLLRLSAKSDVALKQQAQRLAAWLGTHPQTRLADVAYTLDRGRTRFDKRAVVVANDLALAQTRLLSAELATGSPSNTRPSLVFMFPGQGSQHVGMGRKLYETESVFRSEVDRCATILQPLLGLDLRDLLYPASERSESAASALRATQLAQPAIFSISYATAKLWQSWGLQPEHMIGHSVGEFVAATLAGVFDLEHALAILAERARLMQSMPAGGMLAVRLSESEAMRYCDAEIAIAGVNSPHLTVLSAPHPALDALKTKLEAEGTGTTVLHTSHAFHSAMMDPVMQPFSAIVGRYPRSAPRLPFYSSLTGRPITAEQAQDPAYWAQQLRNAVRFAPGLIELAAQPGRVFLECGPGQNLSTSARQSLQGAQQAAVIASLPHSGAENADDAEHLSLALGRLWLAGVEPDTIRFYAGETRVKLGLPGYPFARDRHFIEPLRQVTTVADPAAEAAVEAVPVVAATAAPASPEERAMELAAKIFDDVTGIKIGAAERNKTFLELGFDSLLLTQVASKLKIAFKNNLRFRQLLEEFTTLTALGGYLAPNVDQAGSAKAAAPSQTSAVATPSTTADGKPAKAFGAGVRINKSKDDGLSRLQRKSLDALTARYLARTGRSKASAQKHRAYLADPRTVSGFRPLWKEIIYPIVSTHSDGAHIWDVDGHQYIDVINGYGAVFFGHKPEFVNRAIVEQIQKGYEIGPIQDFIGDVAERFTKMTGNERVAFCNTGSEAVSAAVRCARTVSGKDLVVSFTGDYHGIHDEVIVRAGPQGRGLPAAGGIPNAHVSHTLILDYGDPKSLDIIRARADELAAIMIEPVQSRRPDLQPREFMHACREIANQCGCALIMDEVVCGFRVAPGGAQEYFGVKGDINAYGKVFGGGMPIGAVAGIAKYMDALDGGFWQYGDESMPEVGVTYFAGTFVRHPVNMAVVGACLKFLEEHAGIQQEMNERIGAYVTRLRAMLEQLRAPLRVAHFSSLFRFEFTQDEPFGELFYHYLRERGLHSFDGRMAVMTIRHDAAILDRMLEIYRDAITCMQRDGLMGTVGQPVVMGQERTASAQRGYVSPTANARIGRRVDGTPAWFIPDPDTPDRWREVLAEQEEISA